VKKLKDTCLTAGAGKTNPTVRQLTEYPMVYTATDGKTKRMGEIIYVTTRQEVERLDLGRFLANFGLNQSKRKLRQVRGRIIYTVHGYEENEEEIYEIPEVRRFYSLIHQVWPCWLYTACLASPSLLVIALSVVGNMSVARSGNECRIRIPGPDLKKFFLESLPPVALLNHKAGISREFGIQYLQSVASHLKVSEE
jgi:hypothetical protein